MTFFVDYNLDGYALIFLGVLAKRSWLEFQPVQFVTFREAELPMESSDRVVWRYAQEHEMMILTANRNMKGEDSLEQVMREENTETSFPVLTIGNLDRLSEAEYRERCAERLIEVAVDIDNYKGVGRLFIL